MRLPLNVPVATGRPFIELAREVATIILHTVEAGWLLALEFRDVSVGAQELAITERLRDGMRSALNSGMFAWKGRMVVLSGTESRSRPEVILPDGRTDIPILVIEIFLRFGDHDPHAIIECKRIAGSDSHLCREYVVEGIDRFRLGKYGGNHSTGFMVGYLIADDTQDAATGINRYLNRASRGAENLEPSNLGGAPRAWRSTHPRAASSSIELHHVFLSFVGS
ncbi:MAG: hypothetical protein OXB98_12985 [Bryobacterales bacterium]|nr:hypothetical protein [Bryobacterales bacterium]